MLPAAVPERLPLALQDRERGRVRDVDHIAAHARGADREQPPATAGRDGLIARGSPHRRGSGKAGTSQRKSTVAAAAPRSCATMNPARRPAGCPRTCRWRRARASPPGLANDVEAVNQ